MREESGFTIIELLVTMVIVGTLAGIAITAFALYKAKSYNSVAMSDLRNALTSLEAYMNDNEAFPSCENSTCESSMTGLTRSDGVHLEFVSTGGLSGTAIACHPGRGSVAYYRPSVVDVVVEVAIGSCGT